jgi:hypothetical protein
MGATGCIAEPEVSMIRRIPQRTSDDCMICVVAMATGFPYERVHEDSQRYIKITEDGMFPAWWETYLHDEGFEFIYCPTSNLHRLPETAGVVGIVRMDIPHLRKAHVVAADELGIVDPADNAPDHIGFSEYFRNRMAEGIRFHDEFLAVKAGTASDTA